MIAMTARAKLMGANFSNSSSSTTPSDAGVTR